MAVPQLLTRQVALLEIVSLVFSPLPPPRPSRIQLLSFSANFGYLDQHEPPRESLSFSVGYTRLSSNSLLLK